MVVAGKSHKLIDTLWKIKIFKGLNKFRKEKSEWKTYNISYPNRISEDD